MLKKFLATLLVLAISLGQFTFITFTVSAADGDPTLELAVANKIDVALAVGPTTVNYADFERDLRAALVENREHPVPQEDVYISAAKAVSANTTSEFTWWVYDHTKPSTMASAAGSAYGGVRNVSDAAHTYIENDLGNTTTSSNQGTINRTAGSTTYTPDANNPDIGYTRHPYQGIASHMIESDNGATMDFYGYAHDSYKDFRYLPNDQATKKVFEFGIEEDVAYDALDGVGFFFNTNITGSYEAKTQTMSGYLLFLGYNTSGKGANMTIYKFKDVNTYRFHQSMNSTTATTTAAYTIANYTEGSGSKFELVAQSTVYNSTDKYRRIKLEVYPTYVKAYYNGSTGNQAVSTTPISETAAPVNFTAGMTGTQISLDSTYVSSYGFGPMASYLSHTCARPTHLALQNLSMTVEKVKTLPEVLRSPEWHDNTIKYLVNLNENKIEDFENSSIASELLARLTNDDIYYIGWGTNTNAIASAAFLRKHNLKGTIVDIETLDALKTLPEFQTLSATEQQAFLDCISGGETVAYTYEEQIRAIADEIYKRYWNTSASNRFLVTDNVVINVSGADKNNTADPTWPDGKWKIVHDVSSESTPIGSGGLLMTNFEGVHPKSGQYMSDLDFQFYLPGTYYIYYRDVGLTSVVAHRPPVAGFEVTRDELDVPTFANTSYDPDVYDSGGVNGENRGIAKSEFNWIDLSDDTMKTPANGTPSVLIADHIYLITLTVEDEFGATASASRQITLTSTVVEAYPPFADFTLTPSTIMKSADPDVILGQKIIITDKSYDSYDMPYTSTYTVYKDDVPYAGLTITAADFNGRIAEIPVGSLPAGQYTVELVVTSVNGTSAPATRSFSIVADTIAPAAAANPAPPQTFTANATVKLTFSDDGGSGFKESRVAVTQSTDTPASGSSLWKALSSSVTRDVVINQAGNNYIYWEAWDNAGNKGTGSFGPYELTKQGIGLTLTASAQDTSGTVEYNKPGYGIVLTAELNMDSPMPTGSVFFYQGSALLGGAAIQDIGGVPTAVWTGPAAAAGENCQFRAEYGGDVNYDDASGTDTYTVAPSPDVTITAGTQTDKVYDADPYLPTNITVTGASTYIVEYEGRGGTSYLRSTQAPVNVGNYTVIATTTDSNYEEKTGSASFAIVPRTLTLTLSTDTSDATIQSTVTLTVLIENAKNLPAGSIEFYISGSLGGTASSGSFIPANSADYTASVQWSGMPVGEYDIIVKYVPAASDNYVANDDEIIGFSIDKADQTFGFSEATVYKTFGDANFYVEATGADTSGAVTYEVTSGTDVVSVNTSTGEVTILGAGTAIIKATKQGDSDYNQATATITIIVDKKAPLFQFEIMGSDTLVSDVVEFGDPVIPDVTANEGGGLVSYLYEGTGGTTYGPSEYPPTAVGTYTVTAEVSETANYESAQSVVNFEIVQCGCNITSIVFPDATIEIPFHKAQESYQLNATAVLQSCGRAGHGESFSYQYEIVAIFDSAGAVINNTKGTLTVNNRAVGDIIRVKVTAAHIPTGKTADGFAQFVVIKGADTGNASEIVNKNDNNHDVLVEISSLYDPEDNTGKFEIEVIYVGGPRTPMMNNLLDEGQANDYIIDADGNIVFTDTFIDSLLAGTHEIEITILNMQTGTPETLVCYIDIVSGAVVVSVEKTDASLPNVSGNQQALGSAVFGLDSAGNQNAMDYGYNVRIDLIISDIQISDDANVVRSNEKGKQIGAIIDISLLKTIKGSNEYIKELGSGITLTIDIPQNIRGKKTYWIARVHHPSGGGTQYALLPAAIVNNGTQLSFETDKFSTIAILYESGSSTGTPGSTGSTSSGSGTYSSGQGKTEPGQPDSGSKKQYIEKPFINGYPDGSFRPDQGITRAEAVQIIYNLYGNNAIVTNGNLSGFTDVDGHWAFNAIAWAAGRGYIVGYGDGTIRPDVSITRAEFSALIYRLALEKNLLTGTDAEDVAFSDIEGHWAYDQIMAIAENGGIKGYDDGTFRPQNAITRAEAVSIFSHTLNRRREFSPDIFFEDAAESHWAYIEIMNAVNGLIEEL